jgi:PLAT/LH2 domain
VRKIARLALTLTVAAAALLSSVAHADTYTVYVQTGTLDRTNSRATDDPGTDARVSIAMGGSGAKWPAMPLGTGRATDFDAGNIDVFTIDAPRLGELTSLEISHDNTGASPEWYLEWVVIRDETTGQAFYFPHHGWLGGQAFLPGQRLSATLSARAQVPTDAR